MTTTTTTIQIRQYLAVEKLRAITRMLTAPRPGGIGLAVPHEIGGLADAERPVQLRLSPAIGRVHSLRRWADALEEVTSVTLYRGLPIADVHVKVLGRIPRGPAAEVSVWIRDAVIEPPLTPDYERQLSLEELRALDDAGRIGGAR